MPFFGSLLGFVKSLCQAISLDWTFICCECLLATIGMASGICLISLDSSLSCLLIIFLKVWVFPLSLIASLMQLSSLVMAFT